MPDMPEHPPDAFPKPARKVRIEEPFKDIELTTHYRGKTHGYVVDRKWVHTILDRPGQTVVPQWTDDWTEIAPGSETRREDRSTRSRVSAPISELPESARDTVAYETPATLAISLIVTFFIFLLHAPMGKIMLRSRKRLRLSVDITPSSGICQCANSRL